MPTILEALELADAAQRQGDRARAEFIYAQILRAVPNEPRALNALGVLAYEAGKLDAADGYLSQAIAAFPGDPSFHNNLNLVRRAQGRPIEAAECCRRALALAPRVPQLHSNLGIALKDSGALAESVPCFERAIELQSDYADAHYNLANALTKLHRLAEAEAAYRRALELAPNQWDIHNNLGTLCELQGRYDEAMASYERALELNAEAPEVHRNQAMIRLRDGNFREAWQDYEWRWRWAMPQYAVPEFPEPKWNGEPLAGRTILVRAEQGIGDIIQFLRFLPALKQQGARVLFECAPKLHALLSTAPGMDRIVPDEGEPEPVDYGISLLSLPAVFGTTLETLPAQVPYLFAEQARIERCRKLLRNEGKLNVGIGWQGNPFYTGDYYRSIPLREYAPLAACSGVQLYSLQKGHGQEQLGELAEPMGIIDVAAELDNEGRTFVDTAAMMKNLDLVITSDTSMAHLAGALGVEVWVALQYSPNWRWLIERSDCPWYPTMRLFRQPRFADWSGVFDRIAVALAARAAASR